MSWSANSMNCMVMPTISEDSDRHHASLSSLGGGLTGAGEGLGGNVEEAGAHDANIEQVF